MAIDGLVAVGFLDEQRVIVGSHSGVGVVDVCSGVQISRVLDHDGSYGWFSDAPPSATWMDSDGPRTVPVAGLWGGHLSQATSDGWTCERSAVGVALKGPNGNTLTMNDEEEVRACGSSPHGRVFVFATSPTLYLVTR